VLGSTSVARSAGTISTTAGVGLGVGVGAALVASSVAASAAFFSGLVVQAAARRPTAAAAAKWRRERGPRGSLVTGCHVRTIVGCRFGRRSRPNPHFSRVDRPRPKAVGPHHNSGGGRGVPSGERRAGPIRGGVHPSSTRRSSRSGPGRRRRRRSQRPTSRPRGRGSRSRPRVRATAATSCRG